MRRTLVIGTFLSNGWRNPDCYSNLYTTALTVPKNATMLKVVTYRGKCPIGKQINLTIEELKEKIFSGEIEDAKTVSSLMAYAVKYGK